MNCLWDLKQDTLKVNPTVDDPVHWWGSTPPTVHNSQRTEGLTNLAARLGSERVKGFHRAFYHDVNLGLFQPVGQGPAFQCSCTYVQEVQSPSSIT